MAPYWVVLLATVASFLLSTLSYSLRDLSRVRLAEQLERRGRSAYLEPTADHAEDLSFLMSALRLFANTLILLGVFWWFERSGHGVAARYALSFLLAGAVTFLFAVAIPHALARYAREAVVAFFVVPMHAVRRAMLPLTKLMHGIDALVRGATGNAAEPGPETLEQEIQQDILSAVEEGEKEGVVDEEERQMIERVIAFYDTTAGQIMTARPEMVALETDATLAEVKKLIEQSGHSRIPVYEGTLDHVVGILYARDLLHWLGENLQQQRFQLKSVLRPALYVPETKPLGDLLSDFRLQKIHIAIVLDEYGGTAGLVTIEDVLEELVGDISDEHEPVEPAMFKRIDELTMEADARIYIDELNRLAVLNLPEDAGYDTLGGFVSTTLGRIPERGTAFEHDGARFTVLDAEPQKVSRVKIELIPQPVEQGTAPEGK
jgi:putative hemolysin